ncbi:hypothetical protein KH5_00800 [Urechidicola sp. KH5]
MKVTVDTETHELHIQQEITYYNKASVSLDTIYLHNWPNSFKDNKTPLSKRLIEDYNKELYFAKDKRRGETTINNISINFESINYVVRADQSDILALPLSSPLAPGASVKISATYTVRVPIDRYTKYGRNKNDYNLRYWYMVPAYYDDGWQLMSNLNMDDLLIDFTNYNIELELSNFYSLSTNLNSQITSSGNKKTHHLTGTMVTEVELSFSPISTYELFQTDHVLVETNVPSKSLQPKNKTEILNREIAFIESRLGKYPQDKLFISGITYSKNPVYGLNQLPDFLWPFPETFEWDIMMFKALSKKFIDNSILVNHREDMWLADGIQNYLMMEYVETFYPEVKALGNISKIWGVRSFNLAKLDFNDKYPFVYQFAARKNYDQALTTRADSLSNFNRKIVNKYKAGIGLRYLDEYLGDSIISTTIKSFYLENKLKYTHSDRFKELLGATDKDVSWFFGDYIGSAKKIDYKIDKVTQSEDSVHVTIKNNRNFTAPVALYGVEKKDISFKQWITDIDSIQTISIPKNGFDRVSLNYEYLYPELNLRNNWKRLEKKILQRPLQLRFFKDIEDPYYNQLYYIPVFRYNFYDGVQLGLTLSNQTILKKNLSYKLTPYYGFKSKSLTGSYSAVYEWLPENRKIYKYQFGVAGSYFHYAPDLAYRKFSPWAAFSFNRKSLRDVGGSSIVVNYVDVNRDFNPDDPNQNPESNEYGVFNVSYNYSKPEIIQDLRYTGNLEVSKEFSKLTFDLRYRKLTNLNRQLDFRVYFGTFLRNNTESDYFSFGLTRQSDYMFRLNYFGRSEEDGFFSQQYITNEGGFKSDLEQNFANRWIASFNTSVGIWRWIEIYNDFGFLKNKNEPVFFGYENGIRLNFVHEYFEVYFPVYSNNGWEIAEDDYATRIRFVLTLRPKKIIDFFRRGFF